MSHAHSHSHPPHSHVRESGEHSPADLGGQADMLDLDAEVLTEYTAAITAWLPVTTAPRAIVDLGSGTGAGTFALLDRFPEARVTAVDSSAEHLHRLRENACARGLQARVHTVQADLDAVDWPDLGAPDLVWASASMHHMADPARVLRAVRELLAPGGLFVVVELADLPRFLPADAPEDRPGLEERLHAATAHHAAHVPHRGADWGPMLTAAGFDLAGERTVAVTVEGAHSAAVGRYARTALQRLRGGAADAISPEDLAALDALLDSDGPRSILRRTDLALRTERTVWVARP
ncbi:class I SAM-dependent methyltransferase [Yinghuangia sp. YIM S09857]|uniref:class I SAM-dependent methyltransferase n=1 Tax=Yinghuangia sp. YIM S09857 TaxID=3436929 RepID=UPI003F529950